MSASSSDGTVTAPKSQKIVKSLITPPTEEQEAEYKTLEVLDVDIEQIEYLQTIGQGWAYPLKRFMNEQELLECMQLKMITGEDGKKHLLSVPITQHITEEDKKRFEGKKKIAIKCSKLSDEVLAVIEEPEIFENRKEEICTRIFGTFGKTHPKVERILAQGDWLISGKNMHFVKNVEFNDGLDHYRMTPEQVNKIIEERNADAVYAFQVRNPLHNGHVLMLTDTREQLLKQGYKNPVLLLHPLGGWCKDDDIPLDYRMRQHQALLDDGTLNPDHTILAVWPSPMYYAGPTEVLWHASSRTACNITHFITGRDPAGVKHPEIDGKDCYDMWHGQKLLGAVKDNLGIDILPFKFAAYNKVKKAMDFMGPDANKDDFNLISGTKMRSMASKGEPLPEGFMSPKGWEVLCDYYKNK